MAHNSVGTFLDIMNHGTMEQRLQKSEMQNAALTARLAKVEEENGFLRNQLEQVLRDKGIGQKVSVTA